MSRQRPSVHIEDLLGPTSNNLLKGHLLRDNEDLSMRIVAQDAFGWQNWMEANSLSIEGSAQDIVFQAGQKIGWAPERIDEYLSDPSLRLNKAIPACVYKGNQDEEMEGSGDVSAWAHLFNLDSSFAHPDICPPQMKRVVEDHIDQYRDKVKVPKTNLKSEPGPDTSSQQKKPVTPPPGQNSNVFRKPELEPELETVVLTPHSPASRNTNFALLGREIARHTGVEEQGECKAESQKAGYRIVINVATDTMRIYNLERSSDQPILVDRNGHIDHDSARVSVQDVECFQNVVDAIRRTQQANQKAQEIEL